MNVLEVTYQDRHYALGAAAPIDSEENRTTLIRTIEDCAVAYQTGRLEGWEPFRFEIINDETGLASDDPGKIETELVGIGLDWLLGITLLLVAFAAGFGFGWLIG